MPKTKSGSKTDLLCTRLTPEIKGIIAQTAAQEGITSSEWLRNLIIRELRAVNMLPTIFRVPTIDKELDFRGRLEE